MNKSNKQLNYIKLGLLAFSITLSPLTLACYGSSCSSSSSSSSSSQPSTGNGVTNLTKKNKTALERSYRKDDKFRGLKGDSYREFYMMKSGGPMLFGGEDGFLRAKTPLLKNLRSTTEKRLEQLKKNQKEGVKYSSREKDIEVLEKRLGKIDRELEIRADAKAKAEEKPIEVRGSLSKDSNSSVKIDPPKDPSLLEKDIPPPIKSVIPELSYYDPIGVYLGGDPKRARDKAKELSADGDKKREEAKKLRRKADKLAKKSLSISDENQREIAKEASNKMHDKATQLENEANDLERSADDHKQTADRWEKRAADKQQKSKAKAKSRKASVIQTKDGGIVIIPNFKPEF